MLFRLHSRIASDSPQILKRKILMANVDLSGYNLNELKGLKDDVERAIKERQEQDVQNAREQILAIAKDAGISVEELLATSVKKTNKGSGQKVQPQYQNPKMLLKPGQAAAANPSGLPMRWQAERRSTISG